MGISGAYCFQIWDVLERDLRVVKISSHLEDAGPKVLQDGLISFADITGNSLADKVAEPQVEALRPDSGDNAQANKEDEIAFQP